MAADPKPTTSRNEKFEPVALGLQPPTSGLTRREHFWAETEEAVAAAAGSAGVYVLSSLAATKAAPSADFLPSPQFDKDAVQVTWDDMAAEDKVATKKLHEEMEQQSGSQPATWAEVPKVTPPNAPPGLGKTWTLRTADDQKLDEVDMGFAFRNLGNPEAQFERIRRKSSGFDLYEWYGSNGLHYRLVVSADEARLFECKTGRPGFAIPWQEVPEWMMPRICHHYFKKGRCRHGDDCNYVHHGKFVDYLDAGRRARGYDCQRT
jgi:hypothetical protein